MIELTQIFSISHSPILGRHTAIQPGGTNPRYDWTSNEESGMNKLSQIWFKGMVNLSNQIRLHDSTYLEDYYSSIMHQ
jgi:hypothetical protein